MAAAAVGPVGVSAPVGPIAAVCPVAPADRTRANTKETNMMYLTCRTATGKNTRSGLACRISIRKYEKTRTIWVKTSRHSRKAQYQNKQERLEQSDTPKEQ